jgi:hypothetical protein
MIGRMVDLVQANLRTIYTPLKDACSSSQGFILFVTALFFISAMHRNILGLLKKPELMTDATVERMMESGRRAWNVHWAFFKTTEPSYYQLVFAFECPALVKQLIAETGIRYVILIYTVS